MTVQPTDPDADPIESIAWWNPADLPGNPAVRPELLADIDAVMAALGCAGDAEVAKATPKAPAPQGASQQGQQQPVQQAWPGWNEDLETIAFWVPVLVAALVGTLSVNELAEAWAALGATSGASTKPERIAALTAEAEKFLRNRGVNLEDAITATVEGVRTDGYAIGAESARAAAEAGSHLGSVAADMGDWTPGASSVARELVGSLGGTDGLQDLLRQSGVTIKSIAANRLADLAKVLAEGAENGDSAGVMAEAIKDMLSDPSRAQMIVATELARAANSAAMWQYRFQGIERIVWASADDDRVCLEICAPNEAAGPRDLGEPFPSGDTEPPGHPGCRCALVPA